MKHGDQPRHHRAHHPGLVVAHVLELEKCACAGLPREIRIPMDHGVVAQDGRAQQEGREWEQGIAPEYCHAHDGLRDHEPDGQGAEQAGLLLVTDLLKAENERDNERDNIVGYQELVEHDDSVCFILVAQ